MPSFSATFPSIDQVSAAQQWSEQDRNLYNKMPYYLEKLDAERPPEWVTFDRLITDTMPWKQNEGEVGRLVIPEPSPIVRQEARPNYITNDPKRDAYSMLERTLDFRLHRQEFVSPHFGFVPSFQDFLKGNLIPTRKEIQRQIKYFLEIFYRTHLWDTAPYMYVAGRGMVEAPVGLSAEGVSNKTAQWIQAEINLGGTSGKEPDYLSFKEIYRAIEEFKDNGATPYEGSGQPGGDSQPLNERYCFVTSSGQWLQWVDDPWLKENKPIDMNIVTQAFKGDLFGVARCKLERFPLRWGMDADKLPTLHAPETTENGSALNLRNWTRPNRNYTDPAISEIEVGWLIGGRSPKKLTVGAPPEFFAGGTSDPAKIAGMSWNGQVYASKNFLIPKKDSNGNIQFDANEFGRYVRFQAELACGIVNPFPFNVTPVIYRRRRGYTTTI